jgi:hypothetical protein
MQFLQHFDRSWLRAKLDPEEYFLRLLQSRPATRSAAFREEVVQDREKVREVWKEGDELWFWQSFIGEGPSGAIGLAVLRDGEVFRAWSTGFVL